MDTNALKKFAQAARNLLIDQVRSKLNLVLDPASLPRREHPKAMEALDAAIARDGEAHVIEQVAYTWFNRFTALRFMDVNGYTGIGVVSPVEGQTHPEILTEAMAGNLPEGTPAEIASHIDGRTSSNDPQAEAYRLLLIYYCNQWHDPMPFLFEELDDYAELLMPEDLLSQTSILARLREVMTEGECQDVEIIGWLYQFYISEKKDQVFAGLKKKNQKITRENIPAATQLFTPHWIVRYLMENSLGRLWLLNRPQSRLAERMDYYVAPEVPETDFLIINHPEEIRICDPAAGSGHMLTYAFDLLYAIYEEEGYDPTEIPALILTHNLTGVEIDDRAGALAAFALAMKAAARLGRRRLLRMQAKPDICVLQDVEFTPREIQDVATVLGADLFTDELRETLTQFEQAKNFGSLITPKLRDLAETLRVVKAEIPAADLMLQPALKRVVSVIRMAEVLSSRYHVVVANPPYAATSGLNATIQTFAKKKFPDSKADLSAIFMVRGLSLCKAHGTMAMINMQSWMFLSSFEKLRKKLLSNSTLLSMAHLGERAFDTIGGAVVSTTSFVFQNALHRAYKGDYVRLVDGRSEAEKRTSLKQVINDRGCNWFYRASAKDFKKIPGTPIAYWISEETRAAFARGTPFKDIGVPKVGMQTSNNDKYLRLWHEISYEPFVSSDSVKPIWIKYIKGGSFRRWYGNLDYLLHYNKRPKHILAQRNATLLPLDNLSCPKGTWTDLTSGKFSARFAPRDSFHDISGHCFYPKQKDLNWLLGYANSANFDAFLSIVNSSFHFQVGDVGKMPILPVDKAQVSRNVAILINFAKSDWDAYETSWDFTKLPLLSPDHRGETLEDSYAALRAHWQSMTDEMQRLEEENNRIFIDAYGLQDELTPEVPIEEITLTCNPANRYGVKSAKKGREARLCADTMAEFLSYAVGCMFGRYSLDAPGLILANQGERFKDYLACIPEPSFLPDKDNVIPVLDGDWFPDDITERFRQFLRVTFGEVHFRENLRYIEKALGKDIRKYFTKNFYLDHVIRYKKRPIYWMFSSPKGTFNALIYMHRYRADTVSVLLNDYLREFISKLEGERGRLEKLSDDLNASQGQRTKALNKMADIAKQIDELDEWERDVIFPLAQVRIEIDLDDGVKANYPKFDTALRKVSGLEAKND